MSLKDEWSFNSLEDDTQNEAKNLIQSQTQGRSWTLSSKHPSITFQPNNPKTNQNYASPYDILCTQVFQNWENR